MRTKIALAILLTFGVLRSYSQTQEEFEKIKRMQDSMMNLPQMRDMMQQMKKMPEMHEMQEQSEKTTEKLKAKETNNSDRWYWTNTIASENGKFTEWTGGEAEIAMAYKGPVLNTIKIGRIEADGRVVFNLPRSVSTKTSFERQLGPQGLLYDLYGNTPVNFMNKEAGFITNTSLLILFRSIQ